MKNLEKKEVDDYLDNGFIFPLNILNDQEVSDHQDFIQKSEAEQEFRFHGKNKPHLFCRSTYKILTNEILLDKIESIIGKNILLWDSAYLVKEPNDKKFVSYHQDLEYFGLSNPNFLAVWIAITDSNIDNGCVKFIPKSHKKGRMPHKNENNKNNILIRGQTLEVNDKESVNVILKPGQASFHHGYVIHASDNNYSSRTRVGLTAQYIATDNKQINLPGDSALLVRGVDKFNYFKEDPVPKGDFLQESMVLQREAKEFKTKVYKIGELDKQV
jgi:non-haem Fe2+, alpha-ketoglutarate-dependent halogenase